jgi:hypothetical protein
VSRDDQTICGEIKTAITFVIIGVGKEDTPGRAMSELMRCGCSSVRVTRAAENWEMLIGGHGPEKGNVQTHNINSLCRKVVQEVCSCVQSFSPITSRKGSLDKQSADDIVNGMNDTFGFTILRGYVWARHPELCDIRQEEDPGGRVVKLVPVVALDGFDLPVELIRHISKEIGQSGECVRFKL